LKIFCNAFEYCVQTLSCPKSYPVIKYHNPSLYKQSFCKFSLTWKSSLIQIAIPSACSQLSSIPNLQKCAKHHNIPQQSVQKQQHCNIPHFLVPLFCCPKCCFVSVKFYGILCTVVVIRLLIFML
jgi:hypothetical protein